MEHFYCGVDLLASASRLEDAVGFIKENAPRPDKSVWGAFLSASQAQQDINVDMQVSEHLVNLNMLDIT
ncbi:hypothetical protein RHMOL_Rhmol08G0296600 [Rhododendron molle]|uniref:Uncharacterized protein n=1 Tax=Rhododendron molle TaxID=49168 RepID=A0ACC0MTR7_RHOML|nr:hypothetical protein RHMOL_Rhmol08G0296600 [Rhododendron molle]